MKKLLKKLLAVALVGVMLSTVACKDYDDDIDGLNNRIDELEGKVALKADLEAVQSTVNTLASIDFSSFATDTELNAAIAKCASKDDIKNFVTSDAMNQVVAAAVADMQKQIEDAVAGLMTEADVKKVFDEMIAGYATVAETEEAVAAAIEEALKGYLKAEDAVTIDEVNAAIEGAVAKMAEEINTKIDNWLGEEFKNHIEAYEAKIEGLETADEELKKANKELEEKLTKMIEEAATASEAYIDAKELEEALTVYADRIAAIEGRVAALEGRIQSLVWVPTTLAEMESGKVELAAQQYIMLTPAPVVEDETTEGDQPAAQAENEPVKYILEDPHQEIVWQVSPAAIVANLKVEDIHLDINSVTRAEETLFTIGGVVFDTEKGLIKVTVEGDEAALAEFKDQPIVALHIQNTNIDYRSEYLAVNYVDSAEAEVSVDYECKGHEAAYNVESMAAFNDASKVVINGKPATEYGLTVSVAYSTTAEGVKIDQNGVVTGSFAPEMAFDVTGVWTVADAEGNFATASVVDHFSFTKADDNVITFDAVKDAQWKLDMESVKGEAQLTGVTKKQYDALKAGAVATLYSKVEGEWVANTDFTLSVELPNTPSVDTDLMSVSVNVAGNFKQGGEFKVEIALDEENQNLVLVDEFSVEGFAFEAKGVEIAAETYTWNGEEDNATYEIAGSKDYYKQLWEANKAALEVYGYTEELFTAELDAATKEATNVAPAKLSRSSALFSVIFDVNAALEAKEPVALAFTWTWENQSIVLNFAGVQLVAPTVTLTPNADYVVDGKATVNTVITEDSFSVSDKVLVNAYSMEAPEGAELVYTIDEALEEMENAPVIESGILKWNGWKGNAIKIKAAAVLNGVELASESFDASFADPVAAKMKVTAYDPELGDKNTVAPMTVAPGGTLDVMQYFSLATAQNDALLVVADGAPTALGTSMAGAVTYTGETPNKDLITINGSEITVAETALELQKEYEVVIKATFSYQYGADRTAEVTIKVAK